jgi:hypothetical protein
MLRIQRSAAQGAGAGRPRAIGLHTAQRTGGRAFRVLRAAADVAEAQEDAMEAVEAAASDSAEAETAAAAGAKVRSLRAAPPLAPWRTRPSAHVTIPQTRRARRACGPPRTS